MNFKFGRKYINKTFIIDRSGHQWMSGMIGDISPGSVGIQGSVGHPGEVGIRGYESQFITIMNRLIENNETEI